MNRFNLNALTIFAVTAFAVFFQGKLAAQPVPSVSYAYPAGAERGRHTDIIVAGQNLKDCTVAIVGGTGVTATVSGYLPGSGPLSNVEQEALSDYIRNRIAFLKNGKLAVPAIPALPDLLPLRDLESKTEAELRVINTLYTDNSKKPMAPMSEQVTVSLDIEGDAAEGDRELRLVTAQAISNPLIFQIGHISELRESGPWEIPETGHKTVSSLPIVLNGQIMPGSTDVWDVRMKKGDTVLAVCQARNLVPYIADTVPGWFQATLSVLSDKGKELSWSDDNGWDPDPVLYFKAPEDGLFSFAIRDALYRGRYDFVYRLVIAGRADMVAQLPKPSLVGAPLPRVAVLPGVAVPPKSGKSAIAKASVPARIALDDSASGVILVPGQINSYRFSAKAGETFRISVLARMAGSALDATLSLFDSKGTVIATNDDFEDKSFGLYTQQADPLLVVSIPETGSYRIDVADASSAGGPDRFYALSLMPPSPDFTVLTQQSAVSVASGSSANVVMQIIRRDNFSGDVEIYLDSGPKGITFSPVAIPSGKDSVSISVKADASTAPGLGELHFGSRANIGGVSHAHPVLPADHRMEAFGNTHLVQAGAFRVLVWKKGGVK